MGAFHESQPFLEKLTHGYNPMTEGVRWTEKYTEKIEKILSKMPKFVTNILATLAIFILGTSLQGNLIGESKGGCMYGILCEYLK